MQQVVGKSKNKRKFNTARLFRFVMKLTKKDIDKLWGEGGPYSEARLVIETRILDESISRIFLVVEVSINPFTFETVRMHRKEFAENMLIQDLLDHAEYRGIADGYVACAYQAEYESDRLDEANKRLEECERVIIRMHKYILMLLGKRKVN